MADPTSPKQGPPKRWVAIVLALLLPCGTGHYYAGLPRRALLWFGAASLGAIVAASTMLLSSTPARLFGLGLLVVVLLGTWIGPIVDLSLVRWDRLTRASYGKLLLVAALLLAGTLAVRTAVRERLLEAFKIPSASMTPTLFVGDHVFVAKSRRAADYGDLIVFEYPDPSPAAARQDFVKRVVGRGGDIVEFDEGHPVINGWRVPSCRVGPYSLEAPGEGSRSGELYLEFLGEHASLAWFEDGVSTGKQGPYRVAPNEAWVVGDNRHSSSDSRTWHGGRGGGVPEPLVKGSASFVWLGFGTDGNLDVSRIGTDLSGSPELPRTAPAELADGLQRCLSERPRRTRPPPPKDPGSGRS